MDIRRDIIADFKQWKDEIIPIEVKAENCISGRSLSVYNDKYHPLHGSGNGFKMTYQQ